MTKKDYIKFASMLKDMHEVIASGSVNNMHTIVDLLTNELADICQADNSRFNREQFFSASDFRDCWE